MKAYKVYWNATPEEAYAYFVGCRFVLDENEFTGKETYATFINVEDVTDPRFDG